MKYKVNLIYTIGLLMIVIIFTSSNHVNAATSAVFEEKVTMPENLIKDIIQKFEDQTSKNLISIDDHMKYFYLKYIYDIRIYSDTEQLNAVNEVNEFKKSEINRMNAELNSYGETLMIKYETQIGNKKHQMLNRMNKIIKQKQNEMEE